MISRTKTIAILISVVLTMTISAPAITQDTEVTGLEIISVTAPKQEEQPIIEVPIAMTVLDTEQIDNTRAKTIADIQALVPNFSFETVNGFDNISIRGVGGGGRSIGFDSRSGLYIDGVYIGQAAALAQPLFGIKQVEVLRGPQGHLFGRNTVSGAISLTTQEPPKELAGSVRTIIGNEDTYEVSAKVGGPLSENVLARIAAAHETRGGFGINNFSGEEIDDLQRSSFRGQLRLLASDKLKIDVFTDYSKTETASPVGSAQTTGLLSSGTIFPSAPHTVDTNVSPVDNNTVGGSSVTVKYGMENDHTFTSISAYRYSQQDRVNDTDYSPADSFSIIFDDEYNQISQEFRWSSPRDRPFRYLLGLYYLNEDAKTDRIAHLGKDAGGPVDITIDSTLDTTAYAAFTSIDADISETLTLNLGGRYTSETKDVFYSLENGSAMGLAGTNPLVPQVTVTDDISENQFTPTIGLTMELADDVNIYGKYTANGFKSGGFNTEFISDTSIASGIGFDPETVNSFEVGMKGLIADDKLSFDIAAFVANYDDFQILQFVEVGPGLTDIQLRNAAEVETKGLEASASFIATKNLKLGANVGILNAEFDSFPDAGGIGVNYDGNKLPNAPEFTGAITVDYRIPTQSGAIDIYGEFSHRDESFSLANNDPVFGLIPARDLVNGKITYSPRNEAWSIGLWARNLLNEEYIDFRGRDFLGNEILRLGDPVTWGLELKVSL